MAAVKHAPTAADATHIERKVYSREWTRGGSDLFIGKLVGFHLNSPIGMVLKLLFGQHWQCAIKWTSSMGI
jgi:hypothetical protein